MFDDPGRGANDLLQHPLLVVQQRRLHHHPPSPLPLQQMQMQVQAKIQIQIYTNSPLGRKKIQFGDEVCPLAENVEENKTEALHYFLPIACTSFKMSQPWQKRSNSKIGKNMRACLCICHRLCICICLCGPRFECGGCKGRQFKVW